ncbi:hypothetical protein MXD58_029090, partial [Frankia sp. AgKG'84/4]|nr:hypothetical protein [Frankia sp. AgKG'84/4]
MSRVPRTPRQREEPSEPDGSFIPPVPPAGGELPAGGAEVSARAYDDGAEAARTAAARESDAAPQGSPSPTSPSPTAHPDAPGTAVSTPRCAFPGCTRPAAAAEGPGRPPAYCEDRAHNRLAAYRRRRELAAGGGEAARQEAAGGRGAPVDRGGTRPLAAGRARAEELAAQVQSLTGELTRTLESFGRQMALLGDITAAEAQVEAAEAEAAERVAEAVTRAVRADQ